MVDYQRRRDIGALADRIRVTLGLNDTPINVESAVEMLGGRLEPYNPTDITDGEAYVKKLDEEKFEIGVIDVSSASRRRFSIAHELGHLFLHMGYLVDDARWKSVDCYQDSVKYRFGYSEEEFEAHEFAAAFLMPADRFRQVAEEYHDGDKYSIQPIADYFNVSTDAAKNRGRWLRIFSW